ncbi:MAG: 50S ribosomal protein L25 [candidate division KSB1 bacterium]|nr:50S ribosomal protein L25 [candidate division KSB1 bacterium]
MSEIVLNVTTRTALGTGAAKKIRRQDQIPGIYYFHGKQNIPFAIERKALRAVWGHESALIDVIFDGKDRKKCVIRDIQFDPISGKPIHLDLMGIEMTEKIRVNVHVALHGTPVGVRVGGGLLQQVLREVEVECFPGDLPEVIELDVSQLDLGDSLTIGDIHLEKITVHGDPETVIATVSAPRGEVEAPAAEEAGPAEPEVITRRAKEEEEEEEK